MGRRVRCASSIPVPAAAGPPSSTPSTIGSSSAAPPPRLSSIRIAPAHAPGHQQDRRLAAGELHRDFPLLPSSARRRRHTTAAWEPGSTTPATATPTIPPRPAPRPSACSSPRSRRRRCGRVAPQRDQDGGRVDDGNDVGQGEVDRVLNRQPASGLSLRCLACRRARSRAPPARA